MRVLFLLSELHSGGTEMVASRLATELHKRGLEVLVATLDSPEKPTPFPFPSEVISIGFPAKSSLTGKLLNLFQRAHRLKKLLRERMLRLVISFQPPANLTALLTSTPVLATLHISPKAMLKRYPPYVLSLAFHRKAKKIVVPSYGMREELKGLAPESKVEVIPNPVNLDELGRKANERVPRLPERFIVSVGRLSQEKGISLAIRSFSRLVRSREFKDYKLLILGEGEEREALISLARALNLKISDNLQEDSQVYFLGFQENPYKLMARADALVLSSRYEGFGNVIIEAMALGVPVIATDCPVGPREIIAGLTDYRTALKYPFEGKHGILTKAPPLRGEIPKDVVSSLTEGLRMLLSSEALRERLRRAGRRRAEEFSVDTVVERWLQLIEEAVTES